LIFNLPASCPGDGHLKVIWRTTCRYAPKRWSIRPRQLTDRSKTKNQI